MGLAWIRLWTEMPTDPKFRTVARLSGQPLSAVIAFYVLLLTDAAQAPSSTTPGATALNDDDAASALDLSLDHVRAMREAMQGRLLDGNILSGWARRQMPSTTRAAERARAWRAKRAHMATEARAPAPTHGLHAPKSPEPQGFVPPAAVTKTPGATPSEAPSPVQENLPSLDGDAQLLLSGIDVANHGGSPKKGRAPKPAHDPLVIVVEGCDTAAWTRWMEYRSAIKRPYKPVSIRSAQTLLASFGPDQSKVVEQSIANGWKGLFALVASNGGGGKSIGGSAGGSDVYERNRAAGERWVSRMMAQNNRPPLEGDYRGQP